MAMRDIKHTVQISTNHGTTWCETCEKALDPHSVDVTAFINHYIAAHGYELLHVGSEWSRDENGKSIQHTVAILGSREEP